MRAERKVNFGDVVQRALLVEEISTSRGWHNVAISPARPKATHPQHGYYRAVVVPLAKMFLCETQGEEFDEDAAHNWLKLYLRPVAVVNRRTGQEIGTVAKSHASYDVKTMGAFIDDAVAFLRDNGVNVPPPNGLPGRSSK